MTEKAVTDEALGHLARKQNELFRRVREGTLDSNQVLSALQQIIEGSFDGGNAVTVTIDCDAQIPANLMAWFTRHEEDQISSRVRGTISVDPTNPFSTYLILEQELGLVSGKKVLAELGRKGAPVYGIAALEQMRRERLIPSSLKRKTIFAWGDVLRDEDGNLCVRCLYWNGGGEWDWNCFWVDCSWSSDSSAAVRTSLCPFLEP
ncbi:MAG: hypothetical protein V1738_02075 [Patescibacteria group bacterium]